MINAVWSRLSLRSTRVITDTVKPTLVSGPRAWVDLWKLHDTGEEDWNQRGTFQLEAAKQKSVMEMLFSRVYIQYKRFASSTLISSEMTGITFPTNSYQNKGF